MKQDQIDLLITEIDILSAKACCKMTLSERDNFFKYQEDRASSSEGLKKKYNAPIRTYYKGVKKGKIKIVYEVDGILFEKLWKHLYMYAIKASMYSHKINNFQDFEVQNDVADIKYQTFFVLRFWGPQPSGQKFSIFFKLIVNNILTTSARRRGVYKEESDFIYWFDTNKYDHKYWEIYQEKINNMKRYPMFVDFMYDKFLDLYFKKDKKDILRARKEHNKLKDGTFFVWNSKNCARTMMNYKSSSIFTPIGKDDCSDQGQQILLDILTETPERVIDEFNIDLQNLKIPLEFKKSKANKIGKSIQRILDGESLTVVAKSLNMKPSRLRKDLMQVTTNLY